MNLPNNDLPETNRVSVRFRKSESKNSTSSL